MKVIDKDLGRAAEKMNSIMPLATRWFNENKLTVNVKKTEFMVFGSKKRLVAADPIKIELGGGEVRRVESYRYLGTMLDPTTRQVKSANGTKAHIIQKVKGMPK